MTEVRRRIAPAGEPMITLGSKLHVGCCVSAWSEVQGGGACFNEMRTKRYMLWRTWDAMKARMVAIMLNPSVADEQDLDPTLTRVRNYAKDWGFGGMVILNAFTVVSTDPKDLSTVPRPDKVLAEIVDHKNDAHIITAILATSVERVMVGWGGNLGRRDLAPRRLIMDAILRNHGGRKVMAWRMSGAQPGHPLYLRSDIKPVPYVVPA